MLKMSHYHIYRHTLGHIDAQRSKDFFKNVNEIQSEFEGSFSWFSLVYLYFNSVNKIKQF